MLQSIHIKNFQSLHDIDLTLDNFTVIVGPSSSGKSAFIRALKMLAFNRTGKEFITHGERQTTIVSTFSNGVVELQRGTKDQYTLTQGDKVDTFTKLYGKAPAEVAEFLGIDQSSFAGQFDPPYLLAGSTGSSIAQTLGELTNVHVIFDAAREANRQKKETSSKHKLRTTDLETIKESLPKYAGLPAKLAAIDRAEQAIDQTRELRAKIQRLTSLSDSYDQTSDRLAVLSKLAEVTLPDISEALALNAKLARLSELAREYSDTSLRLSTLDKIADRELPDLTEAFKLQESFSAYVALLSQLNSDGKRVEASQAALIEAEESLASVTASYSLSLGELRGSLEDAMRPHEKSRGEIPTTKAAEVATDYIVELFG